jgi:hypothetical protein
MNGYEMLRVCDVCKGIIDEEILECSTCTCNDGDDEMWDYGDEWTLDQCTREEITEDAAA